MFFSNIAVVRGISTVIAVTTVILGSTNSVFAATCIRSRDISYHKLIDDRTVELHMKDSTVYRNQLKTGCSGLKYSGYVYRSFNGRFCDYEIVQVLRSPEICALGQFEKLNKVSKSK
jgi:hypothetical protein